LKNSVSKEIYNEIEHITVTKTIILVQRVLGDSDILSHLVDYATEKEVKNFKSKFITPSNLEEIRNNDTYFKFNQHEIGIDEFVK
jgi:hypothetical protein